jgi:anti-sigma28 factor (negative regulator of flagellin synthesis)
MSDTSRQFTHRRPSSSAIHTSAPMTAPSTTSAARVQALRNLVAAGQYHVSAKWLAHKICQAAGIVVEE